jgi:hypothetical protein
MAYSAPTSRSDGYVVPASEWNQEVVDNVVALRAGGIVPTGAAANALPYCSTATQLSALAAGTTGQVLQTNGAGSAPTWVTPAIALGLAPGRLSLTTAVPVTTTDVTAAANVFYALYIGNQIALYTGTAWQAFTIAELSIAAPAAANQMYDVFMQYNAGTPQLALVAWTNDTTRATALARQDGILVKNGATGDRYLGTVRTVTASQFNDSLALRHVWNYYNRVARPCRVLEATNSWNYNTAAFRQANNSAANQLDIVVGVAEDAISMYVAAIATNSTGGVLFNVSIGEDSATVSSANAMATQISYSGAGEFTPVRAELITIPAAGRRFFAWLEYSVNTGTTSWYGDNGAPTLFQAGMAGMWRA